MKIQPLRLTGITPVKKIPQKPQEVHTKKGIYSERLAMAGLLTLPFMICELSCRISKKLNSNKS